MAYYIQHNNCSYFDANYWCQVTQAKNASLLNIFIYLISGRNENLLQLVQFFAYWVAVCSIYGISVKIGNSKAGSLFSALVFGLLVECLMESTTTQNDMIMAAYLGIVIYFLFCFRETNKLKYFALIGLGIGLFIGTKATGFLVLPSILLIVFYCLRSVADNILNYLRKLAIFLAAVLIGILLFALPAGYLENYCMFGHPIGSELATTRHSYEGKSFNDILYNGTKNVLRYGVDFLSLDGLIYVDKIQKILIDVPEKLFKKVGIDLENDETSRVPFTYALERMRKAHEDISHYGVMGYGMVWVVVLFAIFGIIKNKNIRILSFSALLFFLMLAYSARYLPWNSRYFIMCGIFAAPTVGVCLHVKKTIARSYIAFIVLLGCVSAILAVAFRQNCTLIGKNYGLNSNSSIWKLSRIEQLTRNTPRFKKQIIAFDQLVPQKAVVAVSLHENFLEYPIFGEGLTRKIIPVNSFRYGPQPIPPNAEYFLYDQNYLYDNNFINIHLGKNWWLSPLKDVDTKRLLKTLKQMQIYSTQVGPSHAPLIIIDPILENFIGIDTEITTPVWGIETGKDDSILWLGHDKEEGLHFSLFSVEKLSVTLEFTINPGPSRRDQRRTVNLQVTNRCGERSEKQQFDQSTISKFNVVLQPGGYCQVFSVNYHQGFILKGFHESDYAAIL